MQLDDLARRAAREARRGNALELGEALIEQDDVALRVEHAESLDHVVEGGVELQLLLPQQPFGLVLRPQQPLPLRHVLMGGHPPAVGQRLIHDADEASVDRIGDELGRLSRGEIAQQGGAIVLDVAGEGSGLLAVGDEIPEAAAGFHHVRREAVHFNVAPIANDDSLGRVEEQEALAHIVDGGVEARVDLSQLARCLGDPDLAVGQRMLRIEQAAKLTGKLREENDEAAHREQRSDPRPAYARRNAFDVGEYGIGMLANALELGCDCLGEIRYFDGVMSDTRGNAIKLPNAVCMHEEDAGILWPARSSESGCRTRIVPSWRRNRNAL